jgi:predicted ATPase/DNA-binding SARP family transcriptional activator
MRLELLGPLRVLADDGTPVLLPTARRERAVLSILALRAPSNVHAGELIGGVWGDDPPRSARKNVQTYIAALRQVLPTGTIETTASGYRLHLTRQSIDIACFEDGILDGMKAVQGDEPTVAIGLLKEALGMWRGEPLLELIDQPVGMAESSRLAELRRTGEESLVDARMAAGEHAEIIGDLETAVTAEPLREKRWAQLMVALYRCDRQAEAIRAFQRLTRTLGEELGITPSRELRELEEAILLQDQRLEQHPSLDASTRSNKELPVLRIGIDPPPELTHLIGRDALIEEVTSRLHVDRLVTLWGPAGVGKTRVAVRVAHHILGRFSDGVLFIDLASAESPPASADLLLATLRAQPDPGQNATSAIVRVLRSRQLLLVLDNCEHLIADVRALVEQLLTGCPDLRILVTSREALAEPNESLVQIPPLQLPSPISLTATDVADSPAVKLFLERASKVDSEFSISGRRGDLVVELCRKLDGLPLAIELAAARLDVESIDDLARDIGSDSLLNRLVAPKPTPGHAGSVVASLTRSHNLLSPAEQQLFHSVSVFASGFTREMALHVHGAPDKDGERHFDRLVRTSLVSRDLAEPSRWRMLEPAKQFARTYLTSDTLLALRRRHSLLMLDRAERMGPSLRTSQQAQACEAFRVDLPELRAAMQFLLSESGWALDDAAQLLVAIFSFTHFQILAEANRWASFLASELPDDHSLFPHVAGAAALGAWFEGDLDEAIRMGARSVLISEKTGQPPSFWARMALVDAYGFKRLWAESSGHFLQLVLESRASNDAFWQINGLGYETIGFIATGEIERASSRAEEALRRARLLGNPECLQWALHCLGLAESSADPEFGIELFEEAMAEAAAVDSRLGSLLNLVEWVSAKRRLGEITEAANGLLKLADLLRATGVRSLVARFLIESSYVLLELADGEAAAVALIATADLPAMSGSHDEGLDALEEKIRATVTGRWPRLSLAARVESEQGVVDQCIDALKRGLGV